MGFFDDDVFKALNGCTRMPPRADDVILALALIAGLARALEIIFVYKQKEEEEEEAARDDDDERIECDAQIQLMTSRVQANSPAAEGFYRFVVRCPVPTPLPRIGSRA